MPSAARLAHPVTHPAPPVLGPGPGSSNTLIGFMPAWRAVPLAAAAGLAAAKQSSDIAIQTAEAATTAASGTPGQPAALAAETAAKAAAVSSLGASFGATGADIHACTVPALPSPTPHGPGVVLNASTTVFVNFLPLCRQGDKVIEPIGPPNPIAMGEFTVNVG